MSTKIINNIKAELLEAVKATVFAVVLFGAVATFLHFDYPRVHDGETFQEAFGAWLEGSR